MYRKSIVIICTSLLIFGSVDAFSQTSSHVDAKAENCKTWDSFVQGDSDNVLLDFSYAGYKHGEVEAPDAYSLGYKVFNVVDFGAVADDDISDREPFKDALAAAKKNGSGVVFFPEGRYIIHDSSDDVEGKSLPIEIGMDNIIIKGADRQKTILFMKDLNYPTNPKQLWTCPTMIVIKNNKSLSKLTDVTGNAAKGTFSVEVASVKKIKVGDWVCLYLKNNDPKLVAQEVAPYKLLDNMTNLIKDGVTVIDYHQVVDVDGNIVTFKEPIMHAVDSKWGWSIQKYPNYENVGIEDLTFEGNCNDDFKHHRSWEDDGAFKPINIMRLTNSWMRRITFRNISEALSIISCANISVYDISIEGRRGHSAIRSQGSSRLFLGEITDSTDGRLHDGSGYADGVGQWHGCGVSKTSIGAVLWNVSWGSDACFEAHATQPRATLFDNCSGNFMKGRAGGAQSQLPNHLADLTLWNFHATTAKADNFLWWDVNDVWWKCMPPIIVGFHGAEASFVKEQVKHEESNGERVYPESLYEAQLKLRLGYVPEWIQKLKN